MNNQPCDNCNLLKECLINGNTKLVAQSSTSYAKTASCYYNQQLFWDVSSNTITTNPQNTPIKKWNGEGWLESWWIEVGKSVIDFSYTIEDKNANDINEKREQYFNKHNCRPISPRCIMIPAQEYENYLYGI